MIESLQSRHQVVRVRPITFAYTRPLSASDVSGMTGRLVAPKTPASLRKASPLQDALLKMKGFFQA